MNRSIYPLGYLQRHQSIRRPFSSHQVSCLIDLSNCLDEAYDPIQTVNLEAGLIFNLLQELTDNESNLN